jgi:hypothetical protein
LGTGNSVSQVSSFNPWGGALTVDVDGLRKVLEDYRGFMLGMVKTFSRKGEQANLFTTLKGDKTDGEGNYHL